MRETITYLRVEDCLESVVNGKGQQSSIILEVGVCSLMQQEQQDGIEIVHAGHLVEDGVSCFWLLHVGICTLPMMLFSWSSLLGVLLV